MKEILKKVHAHMPYQLLPEYLDSIRRERINPEIYFSHLTLDNLNQEDCVRMAATIKDAGLLVTFHAPFQDLRPGALDDSIRLTSINRIKQVFALAPLFHPRRIVCHPSFDHRYYVSCDELWLTQSAATWSELISLAASCDTVIALENVYEQEPSQLKKLMERLNSERICICFDTGHFNAFARSPLDLWLDEIGGYIGQLHLHDNYGQSDQHLPVGQGNFPFRRLFQFLQDKNIKPVITLEAHAAADLWQSIRNIKDMGIL